MWMFHVFFFYITSTFNFHSLLQDDYIQFTHAIHMGFTTTSCVAIDYKIYGAGCYRSAMAAVSDQGNHAKICEQDLSSQTWKMMKRMQHDPIFHGSATPAAAEYPAEFYHRCGWNFPCNRTGDAQLEGRDPHPHRIVCLYHLIYL